MTDSSCTDHLESGDKCHMGKMRTFLTCGCLMMYSSEDLGADHRVCVETAERLREGMRRESGNYMEVAEIHGKEI